MRGAFALDRHAETETDRFATYAATLGLLAAAAERAPVLALIDDAEWLDAASGEALAFAARRLGSEGVVMLWAVRAGDSPPFSIEGFEDWPLAGLDRVAGGELIERASDSSVSDETADRLVEATGGNPLALLEVRRS